MQVAIWGEGCVGEGGMRGASGGAIPCQPVSLS